MAFPSSFNESDEFLSAPDGMESNVAPLSIKRIDDGDIPTIVSCWKLTNDELDKINNEKRVWLGVAGNTMPPVWVSGENPFNTFLERAFAVHSIECPNSKLYDKLTMYVRKELARAVLLSGVDIGRLLELGLNALSKQSD